jgi:hypothetical protein
LPHRNEAASSRVLNDEYGKRLILVRDGFAGATVNPPSDDNGFVWDALDVRL